MTRSSIRTAALASTALFATLLLAACADTGPRDPAPPAAPMANGAPPAPSSNPSKPGDAGMAPPAPAPTPAPAAPPMAAASSVSAGDRRFVQEAGAGGAAEIALGRMAADKADRDDVKQFGQHMVDDHTKAGDELKRVANGVGLMPPDAPTDAQRRTADRLAALSGAPFDRSYLNQMVLDHQKTVALFRREASAGRDIELKAFASRTLPTLEEHLRMVRALQTKGGPVNRSKNA